jgi:(p)ppGpp synthase/HD superfamily hydrolase
MSDLTILYVNTVSFATKIHAGQTYDMGSAYTMHLAYVEDVINRFGYGKDISLRCAAWLHDSIEDTNVSYSDIIRTLDTSSEVSACVKEIAELVYCVTNELGRNRKERSEKTYPKIRSNNKALVLKLADRIANVEFGLKTNNSSKTMMYLKEYKEFKNSLYSKNEDTDRLWEHLDKILGSLALI